MPSARMRAEIQRADVLVANVGHVGALTVAGAASRRQIGCNTQSRTREPRESPSREFSQRDDTQRSKGSSKGKPHRDAPYDLRVYTVTDAQRRILGCAGNVRGNAHPPCCAAVLCRVKTSFEPRTLSLSLPRVSREQIPISGNTRAMILSFSRTDIIADSKINVTQGHPVSVLMTHRCNVLLALLD